MTSIRLPISKSIVNRLLLLQALHGETLMDVSERDFPVDTKLMHDALEAIRSGASSLMLDNCGTAMRFLTAYCAQLKDREIVLDGSKRMCQRPIGQLVDALLTCGADIEYLGEIGFPPLKIKGNALSVRTVVMPDILDSTQFVSALLLIGIEVETKSSSPYIMMTRKIKENYELRMTHCERDWSAAAFWYEYVAIHGGELFLEDLHQNDIQGDKVVAEIFRKLGVDTIYESTGVRITRAGKLVPFTFHFSFKECPDLYPAVALTCRALRVTLDASDTEVLRIKESDRLQAVSELRTCHDHRMAMALLAADLPCDDIACIAKSYPEFYEQLCLLRR